MINRKTVLILGAGASCDFGFPSGRKLVTDILKGLEKETDLFAHLMNYDINNFTADKIRSFYKALRESMPPSIDIFLETRHEFTDLGKATIAYMLIPCEDEQNLKRSSKVHWYEYLFSKMHSPSLEGFKENKLSFLTFNYDRSLEKFLFDAIIGKYGLAYDKAVNQFDELVKIKHVYGQLGYPNSRHYSPKIRDSYIKVCMQNIQLMHEVDESSPILTEAKVLIQKAEVVCFLGFGYHESNLKKLFSGIGTQPSTKYYGTAKDIYEGERGPIYNFFEGSGIAAKVPKYRSGNKSIPVLKLGDKDDDILLFLRKNPVLV